MVLDYIEWRKLEIVIEKSKNSCVNSSIDINHHFVGVNKMIKLAKGAKEILQIIDFQDMLAI